MNRLHQKCFAASTGVHLLLFVILLVGPAFLASKSKVDTSQILDVVPTRLIDAAFSGGGNPNGTPPPPAPPEPRPPTPVPPTPRPEPVKMRAPEPPPEPVKEVKPDPNALEPTKERKSRLPEVSTKPVVRKPDTDKTSKPSDTTSAQDAEAQRIADARRRAANLIGATARSLRNDIAPGTSIEPIGPGGGGEVYASYDQAVQSIYWHAWTPPQDTASDAAITRATVTIASDGTVLSARIIQPSGDASVDRSVQRALDKVTYVARFPEGVKEKQRTYTIKFDLKARRLTG
jgi:colicin import membrane protein